MHLPEPLGRIVGSRPPSSLNQLVCGRGQRTKILLVLAGSLIYERVELEVDLVQPRCEMDRQTIAELLRLDAISEPLRQSEVHQVCRSGIEPVL